MLSNWLIYRKLPWVLAAEPRDCGASVFASLARFHGHHLTLEEARGLVGTDRDGTTLAGLRDGGRAIGLDAHPAHATYEALGQIPLPAIVHLKAKDGHYLVLYRWTPGGVVVLDPSHGARGMRRAEFEEVWSGYLVVFRRTPALLPKVAGFDRTGHFLRLALGHKRALLLALVAALIATSLGWLATFFMQVLFERILPNRDTALLAALGAGLVMVSGFQAALQLGRLWLAARIGRTMHQGYGASYIRHLMRLPMKIFDARCVPGMVMRISQVEQIQLAATESGVMLVADVAMFLATLGIIFASSRSRP
jgi:ATP-binding cassette subfamily B protein